MDQSKQHRKIINLNGNLQMADATKEERHPASIKDAVADMKERTDKISSLTTSITSTNDMYEAMLVTGVDNINYIKMEVSLKAGKLLQIYVQRKFIEEYRNRIVLDLASHLKDKREELKAIVSAFNETL